MKRLLHVQLLPILSGVQQVSLRIFENLDRTEYEPWLLCAPSTADCPNLVSEARKLGVQVHMLSGLARRPGIADAAVLVNMVRFMRKHRFDIVHTHSSKTGFLGRIAARLAGVPCVVHTVHGIPFHRCVPAPLRLLYWLAEAAVGPCTDRLVLVNRYYQRYYTFVSAARRTTIYNAIDYDAVQPRRPRDDGLVRVLWANRFEPQKDPLNFMLAAHMAVKRLPALRVTMAGDGPLLRQAERYVARHGLQDRIALPGWSDDIASLMCAHDIFCTSSRWEAFGLVHLEAAAAGAPVVATAVEGVPEVVMHEQTGLLTPPEDPEAMAAAIVRLAEDADLRKRLGENGALCAPREFPLDKFIEGYHSIYKSCNGRPHA
ncbi:MAG: glycosyltransferase [Candidatus Cloacimonetes bacterium]|nr:glycosyltransferase [Candidatus Cloacimonadota bacterium]